MKAQPSLEASENVHPATRHHIPEDLTLQRRRRENQKSRFFKLVCRVLDGSKLGIKVVCVYLSPN